MYFKTLNTGKELVKYIKDDEVVIGYLSTSTELV